MADSKISALTATATLSDTDELPLASGGTTKKITGANLKAQVIADATNATQAELDAHVNDTSAAHAASAISFSATGTIASTDVQAAVAEVASEAATNLSTHESDTTSVHGITDTSALYRSGGTDVALADGGTGASLTDPNADRIMFWDDSAGSVDWLVAGSGLTITNTTITASASVTVEDESLVIAMQLFG